MRTVASALVLLLATVAARAQAPGNTAAAATEWSLDSQASTVRYKLVHKLHAFEGVSHKAEGKARLMPDGRAQVMVRIPVESFDSGNVNRDAHMKETVEAVKYPEVEIKALGEGVNPPAKLPTTLQKSFKVQLTFHGVQQLFDLPVTVELASANEARATAAFSISLDRSKIERPSLLFVKVEDEVKLDAKLVFRR